MKTFELKTFEFEVPVETTADVAVARYEVERDDDGSVRLSKLSQISVRPTSDARLAVRVQVRWP